MTTSERHVAPIWDGIDHEIEGTECVCGPEVIPVPAADGSIGYLIVHASLDGRENAEQIGREKTADEIPNDGVDPGWGSH